ncbi:MAG: SGNH/GDSL hydrolase family protein [Oscillospiraceae bacterium]|nr:SGNH/GDSL hydrolase family protein [Oscillospiraceae bacterium]
MKKSFAFILAALLMLSMFAGCGTTDSGETTTEATTQATEPAGLTAAFVGDSITFGVGTQTEEELYWRRLEKTLEFSEVTGLGIKGSCVSAASTMGMQSGPLAKRVDQFPDVDVLFIFLGTNDYGCDTPMGTMADSMDLSFYGAWNYSLNYLKENRPNTQIILMTPAQRVETETSNTNKQKLKLADYAEAIRQVGKAHNLPVIDLYTETEDKFTLLTFQQYMPDKLHLNGAGHEAIAQIIEKWWAENESTLFAK